ncbi:MAG: hypothetical protein ACI9WU_001327, partial [Myxococcota bacterium]
MTSDCEDSTDCTRHFCNPLLACGSVHELKDCDDGDPCTGDDQCAVGTCVGDGCDDGVECTLDFCETGIGCVCSPLDADCDDDSV